MVDVRELWDFNDPAASEIRFRDAIANSDGENQLVWKTQLARALGLQKKYDDAHATIDELPSLSEDCDEQWQAFALLERGRVFNSSGNPDQARPLFERASSTTIDDLRIDALHMLAIISGPDDALKYNEQAIAEAKRSDDPKARRWLGSLLNNTGWTHHELGNYERALQLFKDAAAFRRESDADETTIAIADWCVGRCLRSLGFLDEALAHQLALIAMGHDTGYMSKEAGECLLNLGRIEESKPYFRRAHELLANQEWVEDHEPGTLARLLELSQSS